MYNSFWKKCSFLFYFFSFLYFFFNFLFLFQLPLYLEANILCGFGHFLVFGVDTHNGNFEIIFFVFYKWISFTQINRILTKLWDRIWLPLRPFFVLFVRSVCNFRTGFFYKIYDISKIQLWYLKNGIFQSKIIFIV